MSLASKGHRNMIFRDVKAKGGALGSSGHSRVVHRDPRRTTQSCQDRHLLIRRPPWPGGAGLCLQTAAHDAADPSLWLENTLKNQRGAMFTLLKKHTHSLTERTNIQQNERRRQWRRCGIRYGKPNYTPVFNHLS